MDSIRYLSLFSGIGGLEHRNIPPLLYCEKDIACQSVLHGRHPDISLILRMKPSWSSAPLSRMNSRRRDKQNDKSHTTQKNQGSQKGDRK